MAVPIWVAKTGTAAIKGLFNEDGGKNIFKAIMVIFGGIIAIFFVLLVSIPTVLFHLPLINNDQLTSFYYTVKHCGKDGIEIPWEEVMAVYGVLHEQDYSGASQTNVSNLASNWIEEHKKEIKDENGNVVDTKVWYVLRNLDDVMELLKMTDAQKEMAVRFLNGLREGGMKPPRKWKANPSTGW